MRIEQFSTDLTFFARHFRRKYKMQYYGDPNAPAVFFGCGGFKIRHMVMEHKSFAVVVWGGSDSMTINKTGGLKDYFHKNKDRIFHVAHSHWIQKDLEDAGIDYIDEVVLPVEFDPVQFRICPLGDRIYHYGPITKSREPFYGTDIVRQMEKSISTTHVFSGKFTITNANAMSRDEIHREYKRAFVGIRLTDHDNMALSCIEMGLMGRHSIFNGNIPGAIPYDVKEPGHIMKLVIEEYKYAEADKLLSHEMWDFVNDDMKWCYTEFYESRSGDSY